MYSFFFMCLYCDSGRSIIFFTCSLTAIFLIDGAVYERGFSFGKLFILMLFVIVIFIGAAVFASIVVHISNVHAKLHTANRENTKILNGMHEGVLILSSKLEKIMFNNHPTNKIVKTLLNDDENLPIEEQR